MESKQKESKKMIGVETDINRNIPPEPMKKCDNCGRTNTPLWRSGPVGHKTLCNACGIRYSKKRPRSATSGGGAAAKKVKARHVKKKYEGKLIPLGKEVVEKGENPPKNWNDVEIAALLLLALSCGVVFT